MMHPRSDKVQYSKVRVGAVTYLNARPLVFSLARIAPQVELIFDLPSRLADALAAGRLEVAMIPSIEYARGGGYSIISDACIACDGAVRSVKLYSRVPLERLHSLALDEGSRTSAALVRILLKERFGIWPETRPLPIGVSPDDVPADAVMLIGDRGMLPTSGRFDFEWDLGEEWSRWTGLPFVFALWIARPGVDLSGIAEVLAAARDDGIAQLDEIARQAAPAIGIPESDCLSYLRDHLEFHFGPRQRQGLEHFLALAGRHGLAPAEAKLNYRTMPHLLNEILDKAISGRRLAADEGLALLQSHDLAALGRAADAVTRRLHPEPYRTYNIDRNVNYTNICTSGCRFCAFSRKVGDADAYVLRPDELHRKIEEAMALGGNQILLQGGMHPELRIEWYEEMLRDIKRHFPRINVHGFSPPEIDHIAALSGLSIREVLVRLKEAGLGSLPGGGAEILVDRVRREVSPCKASADRWLEVCRTWHGLGGRGSATMMFGHVETPADRIEHLERLRRLQDETHGFTAFIGWTFQPGNTALSNLPKLGKKGTVPICRNGPKGAAHKWGLSPFFPKLGAFEYLKTLAVARLYLDNFVNLQASWVTQGLAVGQLALCFGANDFGSLMIEENVVAAAGTSFRTTEAEIRRTIAEAGYPPRRRNVFYEILEESPDAGG